MSQHRIDDRDLTEVVAETTRRLHRNALITGSALVELATMGWLLGAIVVDMILPLPVWARLVMWGGFWTILVVALGMGLVWPLLRRPTQNQIALRIEQAVGGMHSRLLTVLDLHHNGDRRSRFNLAFVDRLLTQTRRMLSGYRVEQVADPRPMRRSMMGVGLTLVVLLALSLAFWDRVPTAVARVMMPTANIPPATYLQIAPPGDLEVLHGESLTIPAEIARGSADEAMLHYRSGGGDWVRYPMSRDEQGAFSFSLSSITENAEYFISAGSTWTAAYQVRVIPRPVIEAVEPSVHLPEYMNLPDPRPVEPRDNIITAPEGSTIEVAADVSGEVTRGQIVLVEPRTITKTRRTDEEQVWFEDELPSDAETFGRWRWSTAHAQGGVRSHTFGWDGEPYGFRTRLNPLHVPRGAAFFIYVRVDRERPPDGFVITLATEQNEIRLRWGDAGPDEQVNRLVDARVGDMPPAGQWVRLEVPVDDLPSGVRLGGGRFVGITFAAENGRVYFDRPGTLTDRTESREVTTYEEIDTVAMRFDEEQQRWSGRFPLEADTHFTVRLFNSLSQQSARLRPIRAVAEDDESPRIIVDRPGRDISLLEAQAVPLAVRAVDDYGVATIGVQFGRSEQALSEPLALAEYTEPRQSRSVTSIIRAERFREEPLYYRFVATDGKGQSAVSEAYRVAVVDESEGGDEDEAVEPPALLEDMLKSLSELMRSPLDLAEALAELADVLPENVRDRLPETDGTDLLHPDGTPMTQEEIRELFGELHAELDEQQRQELEEFDAMLKQRQQQMQELSEQLRDAADAAEQSPLSMDGEAESMQMAAENLEKLAEQARQETASEGEAAALEQAARSQQQAETQQAALEQLQRNMEQLDEAREMAASDPEAAQAQTQATRTRMKAQQATQSLSSLDGTLQQQQQQLDALRSEQRQLSDQTPEASSQQLDELAEQQEELDERAAEQNRQTQQLLGETPDDDAPSAMDEAGEPSADAGEEAEATAESAPSGGEAEDGATEDAAATEARREQLQQQQQQTQAELDASRAATEDPQQRSRDAGAELNSLAAQLDMAQRELDAARTEAEQAAARQEQGDGEQAESSPSQPGDESGDQSGDQAATEGQPGESPDGATEQGGESGQDGDMASESGDGTGQGEASQRQQQAARQMRQSAEQLEQFIESPSMQELMAMAERAQGGNSGEQEGGSGSQQQASQQGDPGTQAGILSEEEIHMMLMEQIGGDGGGEDGAQSGYYRLPPRARQSLLQGMREQGPEGYQSLIDAYYRELSREVE